MVRTFTATQLQVLFGKVPLTTLGLSAFLVFGTSLLAIVVGRRLAPRRAIAATAAVLMLTTLVTTAIRVDWLVLAAAVVGLSAGMQWLALVHAGRVAGRGTPPLVGVPPGPRVGPVLRGPVAARPALGLCVA